MNFVEEKIINILIHIDLQSQAFYIDKDKSSNSSHTLVDSASGVQVGDIEQVIL